MGTIRHIILTGDKRIGKSTLWKKVLEATGIHPVGFQTLEYLIGGVFRGYRLHALGRIPEGFDNDVPISVFLRRKDHLGIPESFDRFGAEVLRLAAEDGGFLLMDELGTFEADAKAFQRAVHDCLDGECHVLGVLQKADSPFLEQILNREDVKVFTVTLENRDVLAKEIITRLIALN